MRPGWPPRAHYSLSKYEYKDRVLIAPGPHPVYYLRKEVKEGVGGIGGSSGHEDRNRFRIEYLAALLGTPVKAVGLRPRSFAVVLWKDEASYLAEAWKAHQRIYRAWDAVGLTPPTWTGLIGSLMVGVSFAKAFALARGLPLIEVDHMQVHRVDRI